MDLAASFVVGGLWVTLASVAAVRFGGKIGGFIAGLPATSVLAIFFITHAQGARHGYDLTTVFPLTISVNALFLVVYAAFSRQRFLTGMGAGLVVWTVAEAGFYMAHPDDFRMNLAIGAGLFLVSVWFSGRLSIPTPQSRAQKDRARDKAVRALAGGGIVAISMLGSHYGRPVLGSILSAFPATIVATLAITAIYGGRDLTRTMARPMMIAGVINCMVFALVFRHAVLKMHVLAALGTAYGVTMISAAVTFYFMNRTHGDS